MGFSKTGITAKCWKWLLSVHISCGTWGTNSKGQEDGRHECCWNTIKCKCGLRDIVICSVWQCLQPLPALLPLCFHLLWNFIIVIVLCSGISLIRFRQATGTGTLSHPSVVLVAEDYKWGASVAPTICGDKKELNLMYFGRVIGKHQSQGDMLVRMHQ